MDFLAHLFLRAFAENNAGLNRAVFSALMGLVSLAIAKIGWEPSVEDMAYITGGVNIFVGYLLAEIVATIQKRNATKLQVAINQVVTPAVPSVKTDGRIGSETLNAVASLAQVANTLTADMGPAETKELKREVEASKTEGDA